MTKIWDVLVIGAGPVGLFCAHEAARQGLSCRIIDKKAELSDQSKALALHVRTLDLFEDCGLIDEVLRQGHQVDEVIFKGNGKTLAHFNLKGINSTRDYIIDLPQNKTEHIIAADLNKKGIKVEWQTKLTDVSQTKNGVSATLDSGGKAEVVQASWLIACDGPHSTVRQILDVQFSGAEYQQEWWLADLILDWKCPENAMVMYPSETGPLACFPMGGKRYRLVMLAPPRNDKSDPTLKDVQAIFKERSLDKGVLSDPIWLTRFYVHHRQIVDYRKNRIFFAGDSAHIHSPLGGQGLNVGIQDGYNLIWKIALVQRKLAKASILDSYQAERHPIGAAIIRQTDRATKMILLSNPLLIKLRNALISCLMSFEFVRKKMAYGMAELDISYAKSPIVSDLGNLKSLKVGTFPSDFNVYGFKNKKAKSLYEMVKGTQHHLLLFAGLLQTDISPLEKIVKNISKNYPDIIVTHIILSKKIDKVGSSAQLWLDKDQQVHHQYGITKPAAILIRPDKYIGLIQSQLESKGLLERLAKMFIKV